MWGREDLGGEKTDSLSQGLLNEVLHRINEVGLPPLVRVGDVARSMTEELRNVPKSEHTFFSFFTRVRFSASAAPFYLYGKKA